MVVLHGGRGCPSSPAEDVPVVVMAALVTSFIRGVHPRNDPGCPHGESSFTSAVRAWIFPVVVIVVSPLSPAPSAAPAVSTHPALAQ